VKNASGRLEPPFRFNRNEGSASLFHTNLYPPRIKSGAGFRSKTLCRPPRLNRSIVVLQI
jgi:hypothetical protein